MRRVMGIETEYGVLAPGFPGANPIQLSAYVVAAYRATQAGRTVRWDYEGEDPLSDARGFHLDRAAAHPSLLTDSPDWLAPSGPSSGPDRSDQLFATARPRPVAPAPNSPGALSAVLVNGARLYVDHAHPEYSSPEVTSPRQGALWDKAGQAIMLAAIRAVAAEPAMPDIALYKNNVDGKGASYGTHENYLVSRAVPFGDIVGVMTPFLVTRTVFAGSGRVGLGQRGGDPGFQLSQRADYVEAEVGLETTLRRPIINTRDEPHADIARWRRLHVIVGDATQLDVATWLRLGTANLVLGALEAGAFTGRIDQVRLADPVAAFQQVSRDLTLAVPLRLVGGGRATALEIQAWYADVVGGWLERTDGEATDLAEARQLHVRWVSLLDRLARDRFDCAREVEWVAKFRILDALRQRDGLSWGDARLAAADLQWSDIRPERSLYHRLAAAGAVEVLFDDEEVAQAVANPPPTTRAWLRGRAIDRFGPAVASAAWQAITFDIPGVETLRRLALTDPLAATEVELGQVLDDATDPAGFLAALAESTR